MNSHNESKIESKNESRLRLGNHLFGSIVSSVWMVVAAATDDEFTETDSPEWHWIALGFGVLEFIVYFVMFNIVVFEKVALDVFLKQTTLLMVIVTLAGASIATFKEPFKEPGNGYYASWSTVIFGILVAGDAFNSAEEAYILSKELIIAP